VNWPKIEHSVCLRSAQPSSLGPIGRRELPLAIK